MKSTISRFLSRLVLDHPWIVIVVGAVSAIILAVYGAATIRLNADTNDLIARDRPFMVKYRQFLEEFGDLEYIHVVVDPGSDQVLGREAVDWLTERIKEVPGIEGVYGYLTAEDQLRLATRSMSIDQLQQLAAASAGIRQLLAIPDSVEALDRVDQLTARLVREGLTMSPDEQERIGAEAIFLLETVLEPENFDQLIPDRIYLQSPGGRLLFISIMPVKDYSTVSVIEKPLANIRSILADARDIFPGLDAVCLTGKPVLQADEMLTTNSDMTRASIIAMVLCSLLIMIVVRGVRRPLLAVVAFAYAFSWTYGATALMIGQLNLLNIVFMLVLVGVGLDFGVHVISRYDELRSRLSLEESIRKLMDTTAWSNLTAALTASVVFLMALLTSFQGLRELGLIAGVGLIFCFIALTIVLPALLVVAGGVPRMPEPEVDVRRVPWVIRFAGIVSVGALVLTVFLGLMAPGLRFEQNLLELQAKDLPSVECEHLVFDDEGTETWFGAIVVDEPGQIRTLMEKASSHSAIGTIRSILDLMDPPTRQREELRSELPSAEPTDAPGSLSQISPEQLAAMPARLRLMATGASTRAPEQAELLRGLADRINGLVDDDGLEDQSTLNSMQSSYSRIQDGFRMMMDGNDQGLRESLPPMLRPELMSPSGRFLVKMHPRENVWEYEPMGEFIEQLRIVDPAVTGVPITHYESLGEMKTAFMQMAIYSIIVITILLAIDFRRIIPVLVSLFTVAIAICWTVGAMALFGVSFNLANFFAAPLLIGLGTASTVHIVHRFLEKDEGALHMGSTIKAVIVTNLTTLIGFGCLMLAHHRGLQSLGLVIAIGMASVLLASAAMLPALLALLQRGQDRLRN